MEVTINGIEELREAATKLVRVSQVLSDAASKIDDALAAHIQAMNTFADRLEGLFNADRLAEVRDRNYFQTPDAGAAKV